MCGILEKKFKVPEELVPTDDPVSEKDVESSLGNLIGEDSKQKLVGKLKKYIETNAKTKRVCYLSKEDIMSISSYTYDVTKGKTTGTKKQIPYKIINEKLRDGKAQDQLTNKKSYLCLLLRALRKLPRTKPQMLYRGVEDDTEEYEIGKTIVWKGFSSTSTSIRESTQFLKDKATGRVKGTLFEIQPTWGYDIHDFSFFPNEKGK